MTLELRVVRKTKFITRIYLLTYYLLMLSIFKRVGGVSSGHNPPFTSDFILNLSSYTLTASDISLLNKGLSFIPTVKSVKSSDLNCCYFIRNIRNLKYKDFFDTNQDTYNPKDFINLFKAPSTWEPSIKQLSPDTSQTISEIRDAT